MQSAAHFLRITLHHPHQHVIIHTHNGCCVLPLAVPARICWLAAHVHGSMQQPDSRHRQRSAAAAASDQQLLHRASGLMCRVLGLGGGLAPASQLGTARGSTGGAPADWQQASPAIADALWACAAPPARPPAAVKHKMRVALHHQFTTAGEHQRMFEQEWSSSTSDMHHAGQPRQWLINVCCVELTA